MVEVGLWCIKMILKIHCHHYGISQQYSLETFGHILGGHNILGAGTMLEMTLRANMPHTEVLALSDFMG